jgi:hypothetical protein
MKPADAADLVLAGIEETLLSGERQNFLPISRWVALLFRLM